VLNDTQYHFLLEDEGFILNKATLGYINVMSVSEYSVRGHSSGWNKTKPANKEYGTMLKLDFINESLVIDARNKESLEIKEDYEQDKEHIKLISTFANNNNEKRVISFGLYGAKPKYNMGAIKNMELLNTYFPGWICRFYVTSDVPNATIAKLTEMHAEIEPIPNGMGYTSGMFWRFMIANDKTVDRYIIRDTDSRLNARDRFIIIDVFYE
jgi:hypothetical protein